MFIPPISALLGTAAFTFAPAGTMAQATPPDVVEPTTAQAIGPAARGFFRQPTIHGDVIVFVAEGDLWRVPATGGSATRLTTYAEEELHPAISPDGRWIAFTGRYEGPGEVYLMSIDGGPPARQTWEGGNAAVKGWTPDGRIVYTTAKYSTLPDAQIATLEPCVPGAAMPGLPRAPSGGTAPAPRTGSAAGGACAPVRHLMPFATAADGAFAADNHAVFFTRFAKQSSYTKRYVGGTAETIWRWDADAAVTSSPSSGSASGPADAGAMTSHAGRTDTQRTPVGAGGATRSARPEAVPLTADYPGTSRSPQLWNGRVWFVSDRSPAGSAYDLGERSPDWDAGVMNIWSMNPDGGDVRQHTFHRDYDVEQFSMDAGRIVYRQGADLFVLDLRGAAAARSGDPVPLDIRLNSDFDQMRENWVDSPMQYLTSVHLSPDGGQIALVARGNVFVAPVDAGRFVQVTRRQGVRYREARFLPSGDRLLTLSDESGEVELWTLPANGIGERRQLTDDAAILRWDGVPSPGGRWIVHHDKGQNLFLYDTRDGGNRRIAGNTRASSWISSAPGYSDLAWSPDGRWLAYNDVSDNQLGRIVVYDTETGTHTAITTDRYDSWSPAWSRDGKWLWFLSDRTFRTQVGSPWGARQPDPYFARETGIFGVSLKTGQRSPFRAGDELTGDTAKSDSASNRPGRAAGGGAPSRQSTAVAPITIDLAGIQQRLIEVPVPAGDYSSLSTDDGRLYWMSIESQSPRRTNLMSLEIGNPDAKPAAVIENVNGYELSMDAKKLMVQRVRELYVFNAGAHAPQNLSDSRVDLSDWKFSVDPREEWAHQFVDAWRLERDYFYDPGMNGIDWPAMRRKYQPLADRVTDRAELNDVIAQMVGELSALHIFVRGGDTRSGDDDIAVASLGGTFERDEAAGGWRITHIYRTDPDIPDELSPLARLGVDARVGDVIMAIDGESTLDVADPAVLLRNRAGRQVRLSLRSSGGAVRDVIVQPISQGADRELRYDEWEYTRRLAVDEEGGGRVGYVHLRAMGGGNITEWMREYYPIYNRDALIIDVRHNTGGNIDSWLLGKLLRRNWFWWQPRVGEAYGNMPYAFRGPIVVLVDEHTASDGEAFAEGFRRLGLGTVIGTRTWGGEIWLSSSNFLADRGIATAAEQGVFSPDGEWLIEGWGVEPDSVVDNPPVATFDGADAQLDAAIRLLLGKLDRDPVVVPPRPAYPDKSVRRSSGGR